MFEMFELSMRTNVVCHPYRTARVVGLFSINRSTPEAYTFEEELAKAAGVHKDNHVVYTIKGKPMYSNLGEIHIWCTDREMIIGSKLILENW